MPDIDWYDDFWKWLWGSAILHFSLNYKNTQFLCTRLVHHKSTGPFSSYCISQIRSTGFLVFHIPPHRHEVMAEHTFHPDHLRFIDPVAAAPLHSQTFSFLTQKPSPHCIQKHCTALASLQNYTPCCTLHNSSFYAFAVVSTVCKSCTTNKQTQQTNKHKIVVPR